MLTLPSSVRLGSPHPDHICVELLRQRAKAKMKVEVFKRLVQGGVQTDEFELIKDTPFSQVGEEYISCLNSEY